MIPPGIRIFVCPQPVDMRYGFDRLAQVARERIGQDVACGQADQEGARRILQPDGSSGWLNRVGV